MGSAASTGPRNLNKDDFHFLVISHPNYLNYVGLHELHFADPINYNIVNKNKITLIETACRSGTRTAIQHLINNGVIIPKSMFMRSLGFMRNIANYSFLIWYLDINYKSDHVNHLNYLINTENFIPEYYLNMIEAISTTYKIELNDKSIITAVSKCAKAFPSEILHRFYRKYVRKERLPELIEDGKRDSSSEEDDDDPIILPTNVYETLITSNISDKFMDCVLEDVKKLTDGSKDTLLAKYHSRWKA